MLGGNGRGTIARANVDETHEWGILPVDYDALLVGDYVDRQTSEQALRNQGGDQSRFFEGMLDFGPVALADAQPQTIPVGGAPLESQNEWPPDVVVPTPQVQVGR